MGSEKGGGEPIRGVATDGGGGEEPYYKKVAAAVAALAREKGEESQRQLEVRIDVRIWLKAPRLPGRLCLPRAVFLLLHQKLQFP